VSISLFYPSRPPSTDTVIIAGDGRLLRRRGVDAIQFRPQSLHGLLEEIVRAVHELPGLNLRNVCQRASTSRTKASSTRCAAILRSSRTSSPARLPTAGAPAGSGTHAIRSPVRVTACVPASSALSSLNCSRDTNAIMSAGNLLAVQDHRPADGGAGVKPSPMTHPLSATAMCPRGWIAGMD
jgi:hypothetical protein